MFTSLNLRYADAKAYLWAAVFIVGNLLFPFVCHLVPAAGVGKMLLPIYFFTLIAAYKFGWRVGLATAILSPLANSLLFGMPLAIALPAIMTKSVLLVLFASLVASRTQKLSVLHLLAVVVAYQVVGSALEMLLYQSVAAGFADFTLGWSGMFLQVVGGYFVLKALAKLQ